jgi:uncharacterized membrane protein YjjB (DUF3815 family)
MGEWVYILFKAFWCGMAALGFGILFNIPGKNLPVVWTGGIITGLIKFTVLFFAPSSIILASFLASLTMGLFSMIMAIRLREPQMELTIPSVIPLVPGVFAYRTMFGVIRLSRKMDENYSATLSETVHNGAMTLFITMAFTLGVIITIQLRKRFGKNYL